MHEDKPIHIHAAEYTSFERCSTAFNLVHIPYPIGSAALFLGLRDVSECLSCGSILIPFEWVLLRESGILSYGPLISAFDLPDVCCNVRAVGGIDIG